MAVAASAPPNPHSFKLGVSAYLDSLPGSVLGRLYEAPSSCLAIFRLLPPNARSIVLNLLWNDVGVSRADLDLTARRSEGKRQLESSLAALARLHILGLSGPDQLLRIDPAFGQSLRFALTGGCVSERQRVADRRSGTRASFGAPCDTADDDPPSESELDNYATQRWEVRFAQPDHADRSRRSCTSSSAQSRRDGRATRSCACSTTASS